MRGCSSLWNSPAWWRTYLKVHGTYEPRKTVLIILLIVPLKGLIGVIPIISRVISPVISGS